MIKKTSQELDTGGKRRVFVTGSTGFIGSHLCSALDGRSVPENEIFGLDLIPAEQPIRYREFLGDICIKEKLAHTAHTVMPHSVIHLAAKAEVVFPFNELSDLMTTNINGTLNVLNMLNPRVFIFASTSSVYGNTRRGMGRTSWNNINPLSVYGMSKSLGELVCTEWALNAGNSAIRFRLSNVIGKGCRGLIPYIVDHAMKYPDGSVPAQMRGGGKLIRDLVPVSYVIKIIMKAMEMKWKPATSAVFNVSTGIGITNGEVAAIAQRVLREHGYNLTMNFENPLSHGEATNVILDPKDTVRKFNIAVPSHDEIIEDIEDSILSHLKKETS
jgi:nucleoside-diphosphate-sugar epimerase